MNSKVSIVGGGLVGPLLSMFLKKRGFDVELYERRPDPRQTILDGGRSINLIVTKRGLDALKKLDIDKKVLEITTPVYGRMIHSVDAELTYQPYGQDESEKNYSISRLELNKMLLSEAEKLGVSTQFDSELTKIDFGKKKLIFSTYESDYEVIVGTDGAGSKVRKELMRRLKAQNKAFKDEVEWLGASYKELTMPARDDGSYPLDEKALHIWPRGNHMLMALPNNDGSFTMTLYLPDEGELSFKNLSTREKVKKYFETYHQDSLKYMPRYLDEFEQNPVGVLGTVRAAPWYLDGEVLLVGDAAHGIVPFFGQGMNAGFEDCDVFDGLLEKHSGDWEKIFAQFEREQFKNGNAIADMAIENYREMSEKVADPKFLLRKKVEKKLSEVFPLYMSRYRMVVYSNIPYFEAQMRGKRQDKVLDQLCENINSVDELDHDLAKSLLANEL